MWKDDIVNLVGRVIEVLHLQHTITISRNINLFLFI